MRQQTQRGSRPRLIVRLSKSTGPVRMSAWPRRLNQSVAPSSAPRTPATWIAPEPPVASRQAAASKRREEEPVHRWSSEVAAPEGQGDIGTAYSGTEARSASSQGHQQDGETGAQAM